MSIRTYSGSQGGVGDVSLACTVLRGLHLSVAEGDAEERSSFTWTCPSPSFEAELSQVGCWGIAGEPDTRDVMGGGNEAKYWKRWKEPRPRAVDDGAGVGTGSGGGIRCCSPATNYDERKRTNKRTQPDPPTIAPNLSREA